MSRAKIILEADKSPFDATMKSVGNSFKALGGLVAGYFTVDAVKSLTTSILNMGDELVNSSTKLDVTVEQLQVLKQAAKESGVELGTVETALTKIRELKAMALSGDKDAIASLKGYGVNTDKDKLKNTSGSDILASISATAKNKNLDDVALQLKDTFGKAYKDVIPLLKADIGEVEDSLRSMGAIMDNETAAKLDALGDQFDRIRQLLLVNFAPAVLSVITSMLEGASYLLHKLYDTKDDKKEPEKKVPFLESKTANNLVFTSGALIASIGGAARRAFGFDEPGGLENLGTDMMAQAEANAEKTKQGGLAGFAYDNTHIGNKNPAQIVDDIIQKVKDSANQPPKIKPTGDVADKTKERKETIPVTRIYSDNLTSVGNMLGASFNNLPQAVSQYEIAKEQLNEFIKFSTQAKETNQILNDIRNKMYPVTMDNWMAEME